MKLSQALSLLYALSFTKLGRSEDIVVFVGGLGNWGTDEMLGIPYWGFDSSVDVFMPGIQLNYPQEVQKLVNLPTFVASVGPISSMHDRACELFAIIHGTRTDFGYWHSLQNGHDRYGRDFSTDGPLFQKGSLGEIGVDGQRNVVHLITHSFGGNTARYFERVLHEGLKSEQAPHPDGEAPMSLFFASGRQAVDGGWIRSMTNLATPHDGSPLHARLGTGWANVIKNIVLVFAGLVNENTTGFIYDMDVDHFGLDRLPGETTSEHIDRIFASPILADDFHDTVEYDVSPKAQLDFNLGGPRTYPETYYLAYATHQTDIRNETVCTGAIGSGTDAAINSATEFIFHATATLMGDLTDASVVDGDCFEEDVYKACDSSINMFGGPWNDKGYKGYCFNNSWEQNDGLVPFRGAIGPTFGYKWDATRPQPLSMDFLEDEQCFAWSAMSDNKWYFIEIGVVHSQMIGWRTKVTLEDVNNVYLRDIPAHINRVKTGGNPSGRTCCIGAWCQQSSYEPPSPYPRGFDAGNASSAMNKSKSGPTTLDFASEENEVSPSPSSYATLKAVNGSSAVTEDNEASSCPSSSTTLVAIALVTLAMMAFN